jgi:hypothetical protein
MRTYRAFPLALTLLIAAFSAAALAMCSGGSDARAETTLGQRFLPAAVEGSGAVSQKELAFRSEMRRLWEDHITWTRLAIISLTTSSPDTDATVGRLLQNQTDIGNAIKPFYGRAAGNELTRLLRDHITIAAELVVAAKAGDQAATADAQARWQANADEIATFLNGANPRFWKLRAMKKMLADHLNLTTQEVLARLEARWADDVAIFDEIHHQALHMADMLSDGIVGQFPRRFR